VVIILAAVIGFPQHWGVLRFTIAFLVAAFAVLLISAMERHLLEISNPGILTVLLKMSRQFCE
jgi:hypothetical protein